ncbi:MAG: DNA (cytosine-5-)-methyltransferase, partial [bacterium]
MNGPERFGYYEFFAGGGLTRQGLGEKWRCLMANEICEKKARAYRLNFGASPELAVKDVALLTPGDLPPKAILAWASFPCQDLSLAGNREGLNAGRSGTFWPFWNLMDALGKSKRPVPIVVLENVAGALTSHKGRDFRAIMGALEESGCRFGAMVMDAVRFVPQSRPRLFIVAARGGEIPGGLLMDGPGGAWC